MKEYKEKIETLNEDETFTSAISYEDDQKYILNTEKWISFEEGKEEGIKLIIQNIYKQNVSLEQISSIVNIPIEKIKEILNIN